MRIRMHMGWAAAACLMATMAYGHHAISLNYDSERTGTIEGVVNEVFWANPHVHYYLTVANEDGEEETWDMEAANINVMTRRGIARDTVQVGDRIRITGTLGRNDSRRILATTIERPRGTVIMGGEEYGE